LAPLPLPLFFFEELGIVRASSVVGR